MEWQFVIPQARAELLRSDRNNYCVGRVLNAAEVPDALKASRIGLQEGPFGIFDHFDTFYSVIDDATQLSGAHLLRAYDQLYGAIDKLGKIMAETLSRKEIEQEDRLALLNAVKMLAFLMNGVVKVVDAHVNAANEKVMAKKSKKQTNNEQVEALDWDNKRYQCILQLYNLMQLPLEKLWDPPVCEESFVDVVCDICYRTLEQSYVRSRNTADSVFQILGTAIKRFNHSLSFPVRILQILEHCESAIPSIAAGVLLLYEEFGIATVYPVIIKEIIERLSIDAADNQTARFFSQFLIELGTSAPKLMIPHLSTLSEELLNLESYTLRNCVLQIMGEAIMSELTSEDLTDELKETRDEFLEDLLNHMMDVSAHVRSKVLQIWLQLKEHNAVPLAWIHKVLQVSVERLEDKALLVRKQAIGLIKAFLEHNPFSAKLSLAELRAQYEEEDKQLQELRTKLVEQDTKMKAVEEEWEDIVVQMYPSVTELFAKEPEDIESATDDDVKQLSEQVVSLLKEEKYPELVRLVQRADFALGNREERQEMTFEHQCMYYIMLLKNYFIHNHMDNKLNEEFQKKENSVNFLHDSIRFSELISNAVPKLLEMLMSKAQSDVHGAIDFFTSAYLFGIKGTEQGMQQMLFLVWSNDKEKRENVTAAYKRILFETNLQGRAHTVKVVRNLSQFLTNLTCGHYTAMEVLVQEWVENGDIDAQMIQVLFEIYTMKLDQVTAEESRQALQLLVMVSAAKLSVVTANVKLLETIGFEERGRTDPRVFVATLELLMNSVAMPANTSKHYKRYEQTAPTVQTVIEIFVKLFFARAVQNFDDIGTKVFDFIYKMVKSPDLLSQSVMVALFERLKKLSESVQQNAGPDADEPRCSQASQIVGATQEHDSRVSSTQQGDTQSSSSAQILLRIPNFLASRFIFTVGYVAMREMIYLDIDVYSNMKYRQELKDELKNQKKKNAALADNTTRVSMASVNGKRKTVSLDVSASNALKRLSGSTTGAAGGGAGQEQVEPEEELLSGATAEDTVAEEINYICENEMLYGRNSLLNRLIPTVLEVCKFPNRFRDELLQKSAVLTLIRLMAVSSKFCEDNMPFLMNIFKHTKCANIKCSIVIGLSDFTFRFPNVIEPWTNHMYSTLHEEDVELRLTAVKMMSHLILHEMIRVKGQISELALCIVDPVKEIRTITEQFFKEIAHKSNILYNVLPDIISRLSDPQLKLQEEKYHIIMRYIIGLINKDKQIESLVEKLCLRFRVTNEVRQWRDIAFCLSLLSYNERTIKKLSENVSCFKDKVQHDEIYQSFRTIISNTNKLAKAELKSVVAEFEARLKECLEVRDRNAGVVGENAGSSDDDGDGEVASTSSSFSRGSKRQNTSRAVKPSQKGKAATAGRGGKARGAARKQAVSSDETSDSEEENLPPVASSRAAARARINKKITKVVESDHSDDDDDDNSGGVEIPPKKGKSKR
ncbi:condensin complex subunit 1 [Anopheles ziemanni]|uniref:condensin complex subunit 1 n=1 Tax=Anopheles ziemanni TaxID=345580 RepID=UPI002658EF83|nr:condensin complex subunit 1 isoform X2 [Anopheles coustani]XP_058174939.1 condensin complex subunit 1 [Anopheles ziemanni]